MTKTSKTKPVRRTANKQINFYITGDERTLLEQAAAQYNAEFKPAIQLSVTQWVKWRALTLAAQTVIKGDTTT